MRICDKCTYDICTNIVASSSRRSALNVSYIPLSGRISYL